MSSLGSRFTYEGADANCMITDLFFQLRTHHYLFQDPNEEEAEEAKMNVYTAIGALVVVTVVTSFCADYLVGAIDEFAQTYNIPKPFIGLILLPIVGNAAGALGNFSSVETKPFTHLLSVSEQNT